MSTIAEQTKPPSRSQPKLNSYPIWSPRFWHGMRLRHYLQLLANNRFHIHPLRWGMALLLIPITAINSVLYRLQHLRHGRKIAETQIEQPPVFIIGHWRSGTTLLHELLVRDERFDFPTTYECFAPWHFLVSEWIIPKLLWILLPRKRPMDNMTAGFDRPQEDELAVCAMGAPTPYRRMAFPNHDAPYLELLEMNDPDKDDVERFRQALTYFVKALTLKKNKRLVLKSPPHTGRLAILSQMFPGAKFIHIVRNPYAVYPSTVRTWQALDLSQGFQIPHHRQLKQFIRECFQHMYRGFEAQKNQLDSSHLCELRYEDLVQDPIGQLQMIYQRLELGDFEAVLPRVEAYLEQQKDYQPNRLPLDPEVKEEIDSTWADYFENYGYQRDAQGTYGAQTH